MSAIIRHFQCGSLAPSGPAARAPERGQLVRLAQLHTPSLKRARRNMRNFALFLFLGLLAGCATAPPPFEWPPNPDAPPLPEDSEERWGIGESRDYDYPPRVFNLTSNEAWIAVTRMNETNTDRYIKLYFMQREPSQFSPTKPQ